MESKELTVIAGPNGSGKTTFAQEFLSQTPQPYLSAAMSKTAIPVHVYAKIDELIRIGNRAVRRAQEESRQKGVPNVYSFNGILYYELPNGELSRTDPYQKNEGPAD